MVNRNIALYIQDMIDSIDKIASYMGDRNFESFTKDSLVVDAVIRNFEVIGEAAKRVPPEVRKNYPDIPWRSMVGLRNTVLHDYLGIDHEILFKIATEDLLDSRTRLLKCLAGLRSLDSLDP